GGPTLFLRVVFPQHKDPRTGELLTTYVRGERYATPGRWRQLVCRPTDKQIRSRIRQLRNQFNDPNITSSGMYVDRVLLSGRMDPGEVEIAIDELRFGPLVRARPVANADSRRVTPAVARENSDDVRLPFEFRLDRLLVAGYPFFPRMVAYHNESLDALKELGVNVVWVPRLNDAQLLSGLRRRGLWATATPPRARLRRGVITASTLPVPRFGAETSSILFWNAGTRIPSSARKEIITWLDNVRQADAVTDRPVMGDVVGSERIYSRHISMLGVSRHMLNTSFSFKQYRDWLIQKRTTARPGSFIWTWIQTEPSSAISRNRRAAGLPPIVIEPEQIRLQVYAALAAGCRGLGYWKTSRLDGDLPGARERRLVIAQLNLELELLAPWLSTGTVVSQRPFYVEPPALDKIGQRRLDFRSSARGQAQRAALLRARVAQVRRQAERTGELEAAVIRSEHGLLLLPIWYQTNAQFVPGRMTAKNATIIMRVPESASAWEVTTTGIHSLVHKRVTGGMQITIPQLDQTTAVIVSSNHKLIAQLRRRISGMAANSARFSIELARAKLKRVRVVDSALRKLGVGQPDAPQLLAKAAYSLQQAESSRRRGRYDSARLESNTTLQLLRILQRAHWDHAVESLSSPVSSPQTIAFQSLPEHWRLVALLGRSGNGKDVNLLRSGDFEDFDTMVAEGWKHRQNKVPGVVAAAELSPSGYKSNYALRLIAVPQTGTDPPVLVTRHPVTVTTPPMTVRSGQIVTVSGWVRVVSPITGSLDGAMLYDSIVGHVGAIRWKEKSAWHRFSLIRPVRKSGPFTLTMSLSGLGEVQFDNLQVTVHRPATRSVADRKRNAAPPRGSVFSRFNILNRLPKLPSIPGLRRSR
ncbi:MAG: hypothetical protein IID45_04415, partial [Planctomycetes bacterium]|nr:hypothetical protein [Planctomycetota bacterium]